MKSLINRKGFLSIVFTFLICSAANLGLAQTNLITNGGFEEKTTGWSVWGGTLANSTDAHSGVSAVKISNRKNPWDALVRDVTSLLVNGESYTLSAWVKFVTKDASFRATLSMKVNGVTSYRSIIPTPDPKVGAYFFSTETFLLNWTGKLESATIYLETDGINGVFSDYLVDDVNLEKFVPEPDAVIEGKGWKDIKSTMLIGGCIGGEKNYFNNSTAKDQVLKDCNTVTITCFPAWGRWDESNRHVYHLDDFSKHIQEMKKQKLNVTAHMLLGWDQYFPGWFKTNDFPADTLDAIMKSWLKAIITYKGNDTLVDTWNVVNEAISWDGKGGYWPENIADQNYACELQSMGYEADVSGLTGKQYVNAEHPVYIRKSFEYARTHTKKKLELRDSGMEFPTDAKYNAFYQLAAHLKKMNAPVDAVGFQTHLDIEKNYDWEGYTNNIKRYVALGYEVNIPEVDLGDVTKNWTADKAEMQKAQYYKLVTAAIKGGASQLQTWGFIDNNESWRNGENAFPYTNTFKVKPAYDGIMEALVDMSSILFWEMDAPVENKMPDVMKYNNFGTLNNFSSPLFVTGFKSKALQFDGVDDYISTAKLSSDISGDFTFSCFIKTSSNKPAVIADLAGEGNSGLKIGINAEGIIYLNALEAGLANDLVGSVVVSDNNWHFIALQRDSVTYRLYIDSSAPNDSASGKVQICDRITIGSKQDATSNFEGIIDEVKLYDSAIEEGSFTRGFVPYSPVKLVKSATGMSIKVSWTDLSKNEDGFVIERKTTDGNWEERGRVAANVLSFSEKLELWSTEHFYRVRAFTKFGNSAPSNSVSYISPKDPNTGIDDLVDQVPFQVFPNPTNGQFTLNSPEQLKLKIFNAQGKLMLEKKNCTSRETIDISAFANGIYFLHGITNEHSCVVKLIKN